MADDILTRLEQERLLREQIKEINEEIERTDSDPERQKRLKATIQGLEAQIELLRTSVAYAKERVDLSQKLLKQYQDEGVGLRANATIRMQRIEVEQELQRLMDAEVKSGELTLEQYIALKKQSEKRVETEKALLGIQKKFVASAEEGAAAAGQLGDSLGKAFQVFSGVDAAGMMGKFVKAVQGGTASIINFASGTVFGIIGSFVNNIFNMVLGLANAELEFEKTTGASEEFSRSMTNTYRSTLQYGVSMEEASKAAKALFTNVTDFTMMSEQQRQSLQDTTAILENYGVASETSAKMIQIQTKILGLQGPALEAANRDLFTFAQEIGMAPAEVAANFAASGNQMAKWGGEGKQIFKELQVQAKLTGMEIGKLKQMTDVADTFEGAATTAGKLNAAIGGNMVNAMDLMMATNPVERFEMMRDAIMDTGLTFKDMSYYQRIFYAQSLGLQDVSELALVMSGRTDLLAGSTQKSAKEYAQLAEESQKVQSVQEQFQAAIAANADEIISMFTSMDKLIDYLKNDFPDTIRKVVRGIKSVVRIGSILAGIWLLNTARIAWKTRGLAILQRQYYALQVQQMKNIKDTTVQGGVTDKLTGSVTRLSAAQMRSIKFTGGQSGASQKQSLSSGLAGGALDKQSVSQGVQGRTALGATGPTWAYAGAIAAVGLAAVGIGVGIAVIILSLNELAKTFGAVGFNAQAAVGGIIAATFAIAIMMKTMAVLSPASIPAAKAMVIFAAALALVGGAVWLVSQGMGELMKSLTIKNATDVLTLAAGLSALAGAVALMGGALLALGVGGLLGLWALGAVFEEIEESAANVGPMLEPYTFLLTSLAGMKGQGLSKVAESLASIKQHLRGMPAEKMLQLKMALESANTITLPDLGGQITQSVGANNPLFDKMHDLATLDLSATIAQVKQLVAAINQTTVDEAIAFTGAMDALTKAVITVQAAPADTKARMSGKMEGGGESKTQTFELVGDAKITLDAVQTSQLLTKGEATGIIAAEVKTQMCGQ